MMWCLRIFSMLGGCLGCVILLLWRMIVIFRVIGGVGRCWWVVFCCLGWSV